MKVSIIGMGKVGSTLAFALTMRNNVRELVLVGRNRRAAHGDALDLEHAQSFVPVPARIRSGDIADTADSDILVMCASAPAEGPMHSRAALGPGNVRLMRELLPPLAAASPRAVLIMVSNPVDVLCHYALELTGFPPERVIGSGTLIDSARFRRMLSVELGIHSDDLRAYILGEHGPTQFAAMNCATAGGEPIEDTPHRRELIRAAADAGLEIYRQKGHTNYGIAMAAALIVEAVALDSRHTLPVSLRIDGFHGVTGVCLSLPAVLGRGGIERVFYPAFCEAEKEAFRACAATVREQILASAG